MIVIERVDEVEIFANEDGGITIRQTGFDEEQFLICISASHVGPICKALRETARAIKEGKDA